MQPYEVHLTSTTILLTLGFMDRDSTLALEIACRTTKLNPNPNPNHDKVSARNTRR